MTFSEWVEKLNEVHPRSYRQSLAESGILWRSRTNSIEKIIPILQKIDFNQTKQPTNNTDRDFVTHNRQPLTKEEIRFLYDNGVITNHNGYEFDMKKVKYYLNINHQPENQPMNQNNYQSVAIDKNGIGKCPHCGIEFKAQQQTQATQ